MFNKNDKTKKLLSLTIFLLLLLSINCYNNSGFVARLTNKNNPRINAESDPSGIIALWSGPLNTIPEGWKLCNGSNGTLNMSDRFTFSTDNMEDPGMMGGSNSHNHSYIMVPEHDHGGATSVTQSSHTHDYTRQSTFAYRTSTGSGLTGVIVGGVTTGSDSATHTHGVEYTGEIDCSTNNESNVLPPYYELAFIEKETSGTGIPIGLIVMWAGIVDSIPSGWELCNGSNGTPDLRERFIRGVLSGENPGSLGGSVSHHHTYTDIPQHTHTLSSGGYSHSHSTIYSSTDIFLYNPSGNPFYQLSSSFTEYTDVDHTHNINTEGLVTCTTQDSDHLPPYYTIAFIMHTESADALPMGSIVMWGDSVVDIPSGWNQCNGTYGTPNMVNRFPRGIATGEQPGFPGGTTTHRHTYTEVPLHTHTVSTDPMTHRHSIIYIGTPSTSLSGGLIQAWTDSPTTYTSGSSSAPHSHTVNPTGFATCYTEYEKNLPPYIELVYMQKCLSVYNPSPADGAVGVSYNPILSVEANDLDGDPLTISFYNASDDSLIGSDSIPSGIGTASVTWSGLSIGTSYSWYIIADDGTKPVKFGTWSFTTNHVPNKPINPSPNTGATDISYNPTLSVDVFDVDGNDITVTFYNASDNSAINSDIVIGGSGTASVTWSGLLPETTYSWYAIADDGLNTNESFTWLFTTNLMPNEPINPSPSDGATNISFNPTLSVDVSDDDGDDLTVTFYDASDDSIIDIDNVFGGSGTASVTWSGLLSGTIYSWYTIADDGLSITPSDTWSFTTKYAPNEPTNPSPSDGATNIDYNPTLSVDVYDGDGDDLTVTFYNASDDSVIDVDTVLGGSGTASINWSGLLPGTTYYWYATAYDGLNITQSGTWSFTTNLVPNKPINPSPSDGTPDISYNPTLSVDVSDDDGDDLTVTFYYDLDDSIINSDIVLGGSGTASVTWSGLLSGTSYSWYVIVDDGLSTNQSDTWSFITNYAPDEPTNPTPMDGASGIGYNPLLSVNVYDNDMDNLTATFKYAWDGSVIDTAILSAGSGTASVTWSGLSTSTNYSWYVIVDDGLSTNQSDIWSFITNYAPNEPTNIEPNDGDINIEINPTLSVDVTDDDEDDLTVTFYDASDDSVINTYVVSYGSGTASVVWSGLLGGTTYTWYVISDDGLSTTQSSDWTFTTVEEEPTPPSTPPPGVPGFNIVIPILLGMATLLSIRIYQKHKKMSSK